MDRLFCSCCKMELSFDTFEMFLNQILCADCENSLYYDYQEMKAQEEMMAESPGYCFTEDGPHKLQVIKCTTQEFTVFPAVALTPIFLVKVITRCKFARIVVRKNIVLGKKAIETMFGTLVKKVKNMIELVQFFAFLCGMLAVHKILSLFIVEEK